MTKSEYTKLLTAPEWKAKRLEILNRDVNKCTKCGSETKLHIHHLYYKGDRKPWEYPNEALVTLCGGCHLEEHTKDGRAKGVAIYGEFIQVYMDDIIALTQLTTKNEFHVILWLCKYASYVDSPESMGNKIVINKQLYCTISEHTGFTEGTIRNSITNLVKKDFLMRDSKFRGVYYLNPKFFFKGRLMDRKNSFKFVKDYRRKLVKT